MAPAQGCREVAVVVLECARARARTEDGAKNGPESVLDVSRRRPRFDPSSLLLLLVPLAAVFPLRNNDLWWHLAAGRWMVDNLSFPGLDPFSHTQFMGRWVDNEWLGELLFYGAWRIAGNAGLILLRALLLTTVFVLLREYLRSARRPSMTFPAMVAAIAISYSWWELRPSLFSLIGTLLLLIVLERVRRGRSEAWLLPCLFLPWANLHPGFLFGLLILAATVASLWLEPALPGIRKFSSDAKLRVRLSVWCALSALVTLVNPYGARVFSQQFVIARNLRYRELLDEWAPPSVPFLVLALVVVGAFLVVRFRRVPLASLVPILGATMLSTTAVRFEEYFALVAVPAMLANAGRMRGTRRLFLGVVVVGSLAVGLLPPMGSALHEGARVVGPLDAVDRRVQVRGRWNVALLAGLMGVSFALARLGRASRMLGGLGQLSRRTPVALAFAMTGIVLAGVLLVVRPLPEDGVEPDRYPEACLAALPHDARPFNRLSWGGWLIWKAGVRTYIDGRCWGQPVFFEYADIRNSRDPERLIRAGIDTVVLPPHDPVVEAITRSDLWQQVCSDSASVVYRSRAVP